MITVEKLRELVNYHPHTGMMIRKMIGKGNLRANLGTMNVHGRRIAQVGMWRGWVAKLAWYYMTGDMPDVIHVPSRYDEGWSNFKWNRMKNEKGETLKEVVEAMERKRGKRRVQGNGRSDRKIDHGSKSNRCSAKRSTEMRGVRKNPPRSDHRRGAGDHR